MELIKFHTATFEPCETFCLQCSLMLSLIYGGPRVLGPGMKALFVHKLKAWFGKMGLKIPAYAKNYKGGRVSHFKKGLLQLHFSYRRGNQMAEAGPTTWVFLSLAQQ